MARSPVDAPSTSGGSAALGPPDTKPNGKLSYRDAGVDIAAGNAFVRRIAPLAESTRRAEVVDGVGGFAALCALPAGFRDPLLVSATDGVGTKLLLAKTCDAHDTVGVDLVAMCVNDLLTVGAQPLLFLDYYATGRLQLAVAERVVAGIAEGCRIAGCALVGGETAEMPDMYREGDYDLAGFAVGVVEREQRVDGRDARAGDALLALASSGPHANGYALIRRVLAREAPPDLDALMRPTRIYANAVRRLLDAVPVRAMAHVTGGGMADNLRRVLPAGLDFRLDYDSWRRPAVFSWLQRAGGIDEAEMRATFNCGVGMLACVPAACADAALSALREAGETAWRIGELVAAA